MDAAWLKVTLCPPLPAWFSFLLWLVALGFIAPSCISLYTSVHTNHSKVSGFAYESGFFPVFLLFSDTGIGQEASELTKLPLLYSGDEA